MFSQIPTVTLLRLAENMAMAIDKWLEMSPEDRANESGGKLSPNAAVSAVNIPLTAMAIKELESRGIDTGWKWLVEAVDGL